MAGAGTGAVDALALAVVRAEAALYLLDGLAEAVSGGYSTVAACEQPDAKDASVRMMRDEAMHVCTALSDVLQAVVTDAKAALRA